jgi:hypothetical protein
MATRDFKQSAELLGWMNERGFRAFVSEPGRVIEVVPLPGHGPAEAKRLLRASSQPVVIDDDSEEKREGV